MSESDWLDQRVVGDRWRMLDPFLRARALLEVASAEVELFEEIRPMQLDDGGDVRPGEVEKAGRRGEFSRLLHEVRALASGQPQFDIVDGRAVRLGRVWTRSDRRFRDIERLLEILSRATVVPGQSRSRRAEAHRLLADRVDARVVELIRERKAMFAEADRFMAMLPPPRAECPIFVDPYEEKEMDHLQFAAMLETSIHAATERAVRSVLASLGVEAAEQRDDIRPEARVAALAEILQELEFDLHENAAEKARALSEEFSDAAGTEASYIRRSEELDRQLLEPLREARLAAEESLVAASVALAPIAHWPAAGSSMRTRAKALARQVAETADVSDDEVERARREVLPDLRQRGMPRAIV